MDLKFASALLIALTLDGLDFIGGFIPIAGDILDIIGFLVLLPLIGKYSIFTLAELLPVVVTDLFPTFTVSVLLFKFRRGEIETW